MATIPDNRDITAQLSISRPDGDTWVNVTDYLQDASVELGNIDQLGTGNMGADEVVRTFLFTLRNDRNFIPYWDSTGTSNSGAYAINSGAYEVGAEDEGAEVLINLLFDTEHNEYLGDGFHPLDRKSDWNIFSSSYAPLLYPLREVVFRVSIEGDQELGTTMKLGEHLGTGDGTQTQFYFDKKYINSGSVVVYYGGIVTTGYSFDETSGGSGYVEFTTAPSTGTSISGDSAYFYDLFTGYLGDSIKSSPDSTTITCQCRDYARLLQDTYLETQRSYGTSTGVASETVIQSIIDDNLASGEAPALDTPVSPGFNIVDDPQAYSPIDKSVWDAIQPIPRQIGWFLGYVFDDNDQSWKLTFKEPPRTKSSGDYTLTAEDDFYEADLDLNDSEIRNVVTVFYYNIDSNQVEEYTASDSGSITTFRRKAIKIDLTDSQFIDTSGEASGFTHAILADTKEITSAKYIDMPLFPQLDLFYGLNIEDKRTSSETEFYAIESIRHNLRFGESSKLRTEVIAGGQVIGGKKKWRKMETRPGAGKSIKPEKIGAGDTLLEAPQNIDINGIIKGIAITFDPPQTYQNRWAESKVYISSGTSGINISNTGTYDYTKSGRKTSFEITEGLTAGVDYFAVATHIDVQNNESIASTEVNASASRIDSPDVNNTAPGTPTGLSLSTAIEDSRGYTTSNIFAEWSGNTELDFDRYELRLRKGTGNYSHFAVEDPETDNNFTGLVPNTSYGVSIRAIDIFGNKSSWSAEETETTAQSIVAPDNPTGVNVSPMVRGLLVYHNANTELDLAGYKVYYNTVSGFSGATEYDRGDKLVWEIKEGITQGTEYWVWVVAFDTSTNESGPVLASGVPVEPGGETVSSYFTIAASNTSEKGIAGADYKCDGTNDHVEINAAISALPASGGKIVLLEGTFVTDGGINLDNNITLVGQGDSTIIEAKADSAASLFDMVVINLKNNIILRDFVLNGNKTNNSQVSTCLFILTAQNINVENIKTEDGGNGGVLSGVFDATIMNSAFNDHSSRGLQIATGEIDVINNDIKNNTGLGLSVEGNTNAKITDNRIEGNNGGNLEQIVIVSSTDTQFFGNTVRKGAVAVGRVMSISASTDILISNNDFKDGADSSTIDGVNQVNLGAGNRIIDGSWSNDPLDY